MTEFTVTRRIAKRITDRIVVIGGTGMLGSMVVEAFATNGVEVHSISRGNTGIHIETKEDIYCPTYDVSKPIETLAHYHYLDILDTDRFISCLTRIKPTLVVHTSALVNVDECEKERGKTIDRAILLHGETVRAVHAAVPETKFVYISTDSVFDGRNGNYKEDDETCPLNHYAVTKLAGERYTQELFPRGIVARTNIFGHNTFGGVHSAGYKEGQRKLSLASWAISILQQDKELFGFADVFFNPVYTGQLALAIMDLVERDYSGLIHIASERPISKFLFLKSLARELGYDEQLVNESSVAVTKTGAPRPLNTTLDASLFQKTLGYVPQFAEGLKWFCRDFRCDMKLPQYR